MKAYLGDAVYADFDDDFDDRCRVILTTNDGISDTNTIYLEPEVLDALFANLKHFMSDQDRSRA